MPTFLATLSYGLALACVFPGFRADSRRGVLLALPILVCLHLPVSGITLLSVLRGALGDLSLATLVFLASLLHGREENRMTSRSRRFQQVSIFLGSLFFLFSFGYSPVDVYAWGYQAAALPLLAGGLALFAWFFGWRTLTVALLLGMAGWRLHWLDSPNLWDYLLDAPLLVSCLVHGLVKRIGAFHRIINR
ncbi:MAG: hypothetical protein LBR88_04600 [Zoogloeaceae bacterium]|jgi:hypothetical protein|nr:hypothetical protein [Zoogloeaceae bacterium]